uniref:Transmembrane protein n=1 Tax=Mesocestoides corti TaxID=53468 RepID=A0A5K3EF81_MESCO
QSQAITTRQAPSIRVHHTGYAAFYILLLIGVFFWLAACRPRMLLECRGTDDWPKPAWSNMPAPSDVNTVEYPSPNRILDHAGQSSVPLRSNCMRGRYAAN